jgi:hypothetical protein
VQVLRCSSSAARKGRGALQGEPSRLCKASDGSLVLWMRVVTVVEDSGRDAGGVGGEWLVGSAAQAVPY